MDEEEEDPDETLADCFTRTQAVVQIPSLNVLCLMKLVQWVTHEEPDDATNETKREEEEPNEEQEQHSHQQETVQEFLQNLPLPGTVIEDTIAYLAKQDLLTFKGFSCLIESAAAKNMKRLRLNGVASSRLNIPKVAKICPDIELLDLTNLNIPGRVLREAFKQLRSLKSLNLKWCDRLDNIALRIVLENNSPGLEDLNLGWCTAITDSGLDLVPRCQNLRFLNLSGTCITFEILREILSNCNRLEFLGVKNCKNITSLRDINFSGLNLEGVNLTGLSFIPSVELARLIKESPKLKHLILAETAVDNAVMKAIGRSSINCLDLSWSEPMDDEYPSVTPLCKLSLTHLELQCFPVEDSDVESLACSLPHLEHLNLSRSNRLSNRSAEAVARNCKQLKSINLTWCDLIDDRGVQSLMESLPKLGVIRLGGCSLVTEVVLPAIRKAASTKFLLVDLSYVDFCSPAYALKLVKSTPRVAVIDYYCNMYKGDLARNYSQWQRNWNISPSTTALH